MAQLTRLALYGGMRGLYSDFSGKQPQDVEAEPSVTGIKIMMTLNNGEYGDVLYAKLGEDVSTATDYNMILEPYVGTKKTKTVANGVTLGTVNVTVDDEDYIANEYIKYTTIDGDIDQSGLWRIKGNAQMSSTRKLIGDYNHISVID